MRKQRSKKRIVGWLGAIVLLAGLAVGIYKYNASPVPPMSISTWLVDWQWQSGLHDYVEVAERLTSLHVFALYYDDRDAPYFTSELEAALPDLFDDRQAVPVDSMESAKGAEGETVPDMYLTVVNDIWQQDGTVIHKDTGLVSRLIASAGSREKHVQELVDIVLRYDFDGLELDYERIGDEDWERLKVFISALHDELTASGKSLRVLLEPRMPIEQLSLPAGPDYVMMAYNLYGTHSGPGPKADQAFLRELAARMDHVPGESVIALASGGFDWTTDGHVTAVTEEDARQLADQPGAVERRDEASGALVFDYADEQGVRHTVWYADADTFKLWFATLQEEGIHRVALWRLGGWSEQSLQWLAETQ